MSSDMTPASSPISETRERIRQLDEYLTRVQKNQEWEAWKNSRMHQFVIIASLVTSVAAASMASFVETRWVVSLVAAIPALGVALSQQLHCVEAANLNRERAQLAKSSLVRLRYELPAEKVDETVARIAEEFRTADDQLALKWEQVVLGGLQSSKRKLEQSPT